MMVIFKPSVHKAFRLYVNHNFFKRCSKHLQTLLKGYTFLLYLSMEKSYFIGEFIILLYFVYM